MTSNDFTTEAFEEAGTLTGPRTPAWRAICRNSNGQVIATSARHDTRKAAEADAEAQAKQNGQ